MPRSTRLLACLAFVSTTAAAEAQAAGAAKGEQASFRVSGVVTDVVKQPIPDVEVSVVGQSNARHARTDARGQFDLGEFRAGSMEIQLRRLGFEQRTVRVVVGPDEGPAKLDITLTAVAERLADVNVEGERSGRLAEFYQRRQQRSSFGRFMDEEEISKRGARHASELFRNVPGVVLRANQTGGNSLRVRSCQPTVWVDAQMLAGTELDDVVLPSDIAAIEFYPSSVGIPAQYSDRTNRLCGLILVWTRLD